jgi:hypothetical protein
VPNVHIASVEDTERRKKADDPGMRSGVVDRSRGWVSGCSG